MNYKFFEINGLKKENLYVMSLSQNSKSILFSHETEKVVELFLLSKSEFWFESRLRRRERERKRENEREIERERER